MSEAKKKKEKAKWNLKKYYTPKQQTSTKII